MEYTARSLRLGVGCLNDGRPARNFVFQEHSQCLLTASRLVRKIRFGRMNTARHQAATLLVLSLSAFHHSTNTSSGIDLIEDLEVGENLPRRKLFDFLPVQ